MFSFQADFSSKSFLRSGVGLELRTLGRSSLFVSCRGGQGDLYVNGESRIIARDVNFNGGIAFGVDKALIPLGFGGNCDELQESHVTVSPYFLIVIIIVIVVLLIIIIIIYSSSLSSSS